MRLGRRAWQEHEVVLEPEAWPLMDDAGESPESQAETGELMQALKHSIDGWLTAHQREVLVALALNGVRLRRAHRAPQHDPRRALQDGARRAPKLRADLAERGFTLDSI